MPVQLELRRGNTAQTSTFTGGFSEITVDTDKWTVVVHDNSTPGGHPLALASSLNTSTTIANIAFDKANTANVLAFNASANANIAYNMANTANVLAFNAGANAALAFAQGNTAYSVANAAFAAANAAASLDLTVANLAFDKSNTANVLAFNAGANAALAFAQGNTAYSVANTSFGVANNASANAALAFGQANIAYTVANAAFGVANSASSNAALAYNMANTANVLAFNAGANAALAFGQGNNAYNMANTANILANIAFTQANAAYNVANTMTAGVINYNWYYNHIHTPVPGEDQTDAIQKWLLYCSYLHRSVYQSSTGLEDQLKRNFVRAYLPSGKYYVTSPIIIPEFVTADFDGYLIRNASSNVTTTFYDGNTSSKLLQNLIEPTAVTTYKSSIRNLNLYCNPDGVHAGSGLFTGKNWVANAATISATGSGYTAGDTLTLAQPSLSPFTAATCNVTSVDGSGKVTGLSLISGGSYALPPVLQQYQWVATWGYSNIFDANGAFITTGGTGTGATCNVTWTPDFAYGTSFPANTYYGGASLIGDTIIDHVVVNSVGTVNDANNGATWAYACAGLQNYIQEITTNGGYYGIFLNNTTDFHAGLVNPVNGYYGAKIFGSGAVEINNLVLDTSNYTHLQLDRCEGVRLPVVHIISGSSLLQSGYSVIIGSNGTYSSATSNNRGIFASFDHSSGHSNNITGGISACFLGNTTSSRINFDVSNWKRNATTPNRNVFSTLYTFGPGIGVDNIITGSIDGVIGQIYAGTLPQCELNIYDGDCPIFDSNCTITVGGTITNGDMINLTFSNPRLNTFGLPMNVSYTVLSGDTPSLIAANLTSLITSNTTLNKINVFANNTTTNVNLVQPGYMGTCTTITKTVSGAATETVTLTNSGQFIGGVSGGSLRTGGLYEIKSNAPPTQNTGINKAPIGSTYTDTTTGYVYKNIGTALAPNWELSDATAAFAQANTANVLAFNAAANAALAFAQGNTAYSVTNASFSVANNASANAALAFAQGNTALKVSATLIVPGGANSTYYISSYTPRNMTLQGVQAFVGGGTELGRTANITIQIQGVNVTNLVNVLANSLTTKGLITSTGANTTITGNTITAIVANNTVDAANNIIITTTYT